MYWQYLRYVVRHKWFVLIECCKLGIPWLGLIHDLSKILPDELIPYTNHFYGPNSHHKDGSHQPKEIKTGRDETGYYKPTDTGDLAFDFAWLLHQKRNRHHWQWWVLPEDSGGIKVLEMSDRYRKEMLADWRGAGKAQGTPNVQVWYHKNYARMTLHEKTRAWVEAQLGMKHFLSVLAHLENQQSVI